MPLGRLTSDLAHLLIVDDDANTLASLSRAFRLAGHEATVCDNAARALELAKSQPFDLMMSDVVMPGKDGLALLEDLRAAGIALPVVMISGQANIEMAVRATRLGALDFLEKPLSTDKLLLTVDNVLKLKRLEEENRDLRHRVGKHEIVHAGEAMRRVMAQVDRVASSETRVCILGETGTGKELIARALHGRSQRSAGPFVTLNCAAVPGELIESELFGHEKGSFTGAAARHLGKFEQAHHGTLFLDEIGDLSPKGQGDLLRVLEDGAFRMVGGSELIRVNVRIIAATNKKLPDAVIAGKFREDLFYRLNVVPIVMPPLRERADDIPLLIQQFFARFAARHQRGGKRMSPEAMQVCQRYPWPGNVRQLRNAVERMVITGRAAEVGVAALPDFLREFDQNLVTFTVRPGTPLAEVEKLLIRQTLARVTSNRTVAAQALGISRRSLQYKLKQYGLLEPEGAQSQPPPGPAPCTGVSPSGAKIAPTGEPTVP